MKKILIGLLVILFSTPCFGFEHYLLMADKTVSNINVQDSNIVDAELIDSIYYKERTILVNPKQTGRTNIVFCKGRKKIKLWVKVYENKTCIKKFNGIKMTPVDLPEVLR